MRFLADERLYSETDYCLESLRAAQGQAAAANRQWRAHLYWHGRIGRKQALAISSFLATQDLATAQLCLWLDAREGYEGHAANRWLEPLLPRITVKAFDARQETRGTPLEGCAELYDQLPPVRHSNLVRSVVLYTYGGVYADMDVVFLRDLSPLMRAARPPEFCYRWSAAQPYANSAVLALEQHSAAAGALLARCREKRSCRPRDVLRFDDTPDLDLLVLPCPYFDPLWPIRDGRDRVSAAPFRRFEDFFRRFGWRVARPAIPPTLDSFFPGAFTYHWHNGWNCRERNDSFFGALERDAHGRLARRHGVAMPVLSL
jgi:hypothetical protein